MSCVFKKKNEKESCKFILFTRSTGHHDLSVACQPVGRKVVAGEGCKHTRCTPPPYGPKKEQE